MQETAAAPHVLMLREYAYICSIVSIVLVEFCMRVVNQVEVLQLRGRIVFLFEEKRKECKECIGDAATTLIKWQLMCLENE